MARPRKNPDDPKWGQEQNVGTSEQVSIEWLTLYSAALSGLIGRGGFNQDQMLKTAANYADAAYTFITSPRK